MVKRLVRKILSLFERTEEEKITPVSYEDMVRIFFKILPSLKIFKSIISEYKNENDYLIFSDVVTSFAEQIDRETFFEVLSIFLKKDVEEIKKMEFRYLLRLLPKILKINDVFTFYKLIILFGSENE